MLLYSLILKQSRGCANKKSILAEVDHHWWLMLDTCITVGDCMKLFEQREQIRAFLI